MAQLEANSEPSTPPADSGGVGMSTDEAELLARLRRREEGAYEELLRRYGGRLLAVARRFLRSEQDRDDAVQEAFLAAFKSIDRFEGNAALGTWLHRIAVNVCLMKLRSQTRKQIASIDELMPTFDDSGHRAKTSTAWTDRPEQRLERIETRAQVRAAIDALPEPYRGILLLRDIEEMDTEETATLLGITPGAVKTRLHRARLALRAMLEPIFGSAEATP